ncbi:class II fructose-bisphosphatase [soil metagenome]
MTATMPSAPTAGADGTGGPDLDLEALALHLVHGTQQAALAAVAHVGGGDGEAADAAAVDAMRRAFGLLPGTGTVVIGEGEKDDAPMLFNGERVGTGGGAAFDLAVDPLENTRACAGDGDGAIAVVAAAPAGTLWGSAAAWYMDKLVVGPAAAGAVDITRPLSGNLAAVGHALDRPVGSLRAVVLDKPRHQPLVAGLREAGVGVRLIPDGDVAGALEVLLPDGTADLLVGVGGAPEGVITACSVRLLGGDMQGALAPQSSGELERVAAAGHGLDAPLLLDDLVAADQCCVVATGVTTGRLLRAPTRGRGGWQTWTMVSTPRHPCLIIEATHDIEPAPLRGPNRSEPCPTR